MAALMRTMALFIVEASQLMMVRVQQAQSSRQGEMVEVEVEEGDEEVWMQTSTTTASKRQYEEVEVEQMAEDEREARRQKQREGRRPCKAAGRTGARRGGTSTTGRVAVPPPPRGSL